nr:MAG TPA: hypothetical protein [Caudoviricetes sp.]
MHNYAIPRAHDAYVTRFTITYIQYIYTYYTHILHYHRNLLVYMYFTLLLFLGTTYSLCVKLHC